jgi:hypothetical protein
LLTAAADTDLTRVSWRKTNVNFAYICGTMRLKLKHSEEKEIVFWQVTYSNPVQSETSSWRS